MESAERIHSGVKYRPLGHKAEISPRAKLLSFIPESFVAILKMLLEAVKECRQDINFENQHGSKEISRTQQYGREACKLLEQVKDQLIMQNDEILPFEESYYSLENPLITILERLVNGVFTTGTIDVIGVYKACLEKMVSSL